MIINTGGRTDTVQYYTKWLLRRFSEGYVLVRNPLFPHKVNRYELTPDKVDCVVFCSKNYKPILPHLHEITDRLNNQFPLYDYCLWQGCRAWSTLYSREYGYSHRAV